MNYRNFFLLSALFILITSNGLCQTRVLSIRKPGEPSLKEIREKYHIAIQKLPGDSAWRADQYDMHDSLMATGTYKDEKLTIPHGRFFYYSYSENSLEITYDYIKHRSDSVLTHRKNHLATIGFYLNGLRTGKWCDYDEKGNVINVSNYKNDKLNGPYQTFGLETHKLMVVGTYINDLREGAWHMLSSNGDTIQTDVYKKGEVKRSISHVSEKKFDVDIKGGYPEYKLEKYLTDRLATANLGEPGTRIYNCSFILTKEGRLTKPGILQRQAENIAVDTLVIDALLAAPKWKPALRNNDLIELPVAIMIELTIYNNKKISIICKEPLSGKEPVKIFNALTGSSLKP